MPTAPGYHPGHLVIPFVASLRLIWTLINGKIASNVLHVSNPDGIAINPSLCDAILGGINADARTTSYKPFLDANTTLVGIRMRDLNVENKTEFSDTVGGFVGTGAIGPLPQEVAYVVTEKSEVAGPTGRGRVYLTGFDLVTLDANGHATIAFSTAAIGFVQAVADAVFANGMTLTIATRQHDDYISPFTGNTVPGIPASFSDVVALTATDLVFDSQRRRK